MNEGSDDSRDRWLKAVRGAVAEGLSARHGQWRVEGADVLGPGNLAVQVVMKHDGGPRHVDLGFAPNRDDVTSPVVWDCVSAWADDLSECASIVYRIWGQTTAPTVFELLSQDRQHADHSLGDEHFGLRGWHSVHGPIIGYGRTDARPLQQWCLDHPIIPLLSKSLGPELSPGRLHGVKFLLAASGVSSLAEVRVDGARASPPSDQLLALPWPKAGNHLVRFFVVFVHPI